jgi:nicotinamidase-related amidase
MADGRLDALLRNSGITSIVVVGVSLNLAITNLVFDAVNRSYRVIVPADAVAGTPATYGQQVLDNCLGLIATLTTTGEVVAVWASAANGSADRAGHGDGRRGDARTADG